jgi:hypothetical protein
MLVAREAMSRRRGNRFSPDGHQSRPETALGQLVHRVLYSPRAGIRPSGLRALVTHDIHHLCSLPEVFTQATGCPGPLPLLQ